jgi:Flp pilus assembly protein TadD
MKNLPEKAVSLIVRAETRQRRGDRSGAKQALQEATELSPGAATAHLQLAIMHQDDGEIDEAMARLREVLKVEPNNVIALNNLAYTLAEPQKSPADALPLARRAVALAPGEPTIVDTLAWIEHLLGNDREAARLLEPFVRKSTGAADLHLHAAIIFAALGRYEAAEAQLKETLQLNPELTDREDVKALRARLAAIKK